MIMDTIDIVFFVITCVIFIAFVWMEIKFRRNEWWERGEMLVQCKRCLRPMKFDTSPTQGWQCKCGFRLDVDGKEYWPKATEWKPKQKLETFLRERREKYGEKWNEHES